MEGFPNRARLVVRHQFLYQVVYGKGCFLGVPVLLASAELDVDGLPGWDLSVSSRLQRQARLFGNTPNRHSFLHSHSSEPVCLKRTVKLAGFDHVPLSFRLLHQLLCTAHAVEMFWGIPQVVLAGVWATLKDMPICMGWHCLPFLGSLSRCFGYRTGGEITAVRLAALDIQTFLFCKTRLDTRNGSLSIFRFGLPYVATTECLLCKKSIFKDLVNLGVRYILLPAATQNSLNIYPHWMQKFRVDERLTLITLRWKTYL